MIFGPKTNKSANIYKYVYFEVAEIFHFYTIYNADITEMVHTI